MCDNCFEVDLDGVVNVIDGTDDNYVLVDFQYKDNHTDVIIRKEGSDKLYATSYTVCDDGKLVFLNKVNDMIQFRSVKAYKTIEYV